VDIAPRRLGLTKAIDVAICGDARLTSQDLKCRLSYLQPKCLATSTVRLDAVKLAKKEWEHELSSMAAATSDFQTMTPREALTALEKAMPKVTI